MGFLGAVTQAIDIIEGTPWWIYLIALFVSSGVVNIIIEYFKTRRKVKSDVTLVNTEVASLIQETASRLIVDLRASSKETEEKLKKQNDDLARELGLLKLEQASLRSAVEDLSKGVRTLSLQLQEHGIEPAYIHDPAQYSFASVAVDNFA